MVWLVASATPWSFALESDAAGLFALVHRDGHVTDKVFRLGLDTAGTWRLEDHKAGSSNATAGTVADATSLWKMRPTEGNAPVSDQIH